VSFVTFLLPLSAKLVMQHIGQMLKIMGDERFGDE
jgi:hypothetical protein